MTPRIIPQLPSPAETLDFPSKRQLHSNAISGSAIDGTQDASKPSTPVTHPIRFDARYPSTLGTGRIPLHRRGTSNTYERLEDLLREAGYKDTRVFTPETERAEIEAEERKARELERAQEGSARAGVGAVVGYLAGLVSRTSSSQIPEEEAGKRKSPIHQEYSPPPSPLARKSCSKSKHNKESSIPSPPSTLQNLTPGSSFESLPRSPFHSPSHISYSTQRRNRHTPSPNATPRAMHQESYPHPSRLRPQPYSMSNRSPQTYSEASRARQYLRHIASTPNFQQVPSKKPRGKIPSPWQSSRYHPKGRQSPRTVLLDDSDTESELFGQRGIGDGEETSEQSLPRSWLENVARAVLFGGAGSYIGGPSGAASSHSRSPRSQLRTNPSVLSDRTNKTTTSGDNLVRAPPLLLSQIASAQRRPSESRVSRARVECHSAPASRSSSRVRGSRSNLHADVKSEVDRGRKGRDGTVRGKEEGRRTKRNRKGKGKVHDEMPCLARTKIQNDDWSRADEDAESIFVSSDDDEDGELNLARLLIPPKRQQSIRSLRRHLHSTNANHGHSSYDGNRFYL